MCHRKSVKANLVGKDNNLTRLSYGFLFLSVDRFFSQTFAFLILCLCVSFFREHFVFVNVTSGQNAGI